jgi:collagen type III alpha
VDAQSRFLDVWGTGYCGQQVVGESRYFDALRSAVATRDRRATGELMVQAVLIPEPENRHDRNAVAVTIDGRLIGYLPREDAPAYAAVLGPLAGRGLFARVAARLWWDGVRDGDWIASVSLDLAAADVLLPVNAIPRGGVEIPQGGAMQVTGEDAHLDVLTPLLGNGQKVAVYASLHEITERRPRSERQVLEVRIEGRRVGQLTPTMSEHLLALVRHADGLGLPLYARGHVRGN